MRFTGPVLRDRQADFKSKPLFFNLPVGSQGGAQRLGPAFDQQRKFG